MYQQLKGIVGERNVLENACMAEHTTFKVGGCADFLVTPTSMEQLIELLKLENTLVMGNGSNLLVKDGGIRGIVIKLGDNFADINIKANTVTAQCGARLSLIVNKALYKGLVGMEFASGIPGTLGGGLYMNAGAYGKELKDVVRSVTVIHDGKIKEISDMAFGYRTSILQKKDMVAVSADLELKHGDVEASKQYIRELSAKRRNKQPLELPSAGSTFKRPEGHFAGALIQQAGLLGYTIGGAQISPKHAGFIVNTGGATAQDILNLIEYVQQTVYKKFSVKLTPEVKIVGE